MSEDLRPTAEAAVLSELEWVRRLARRLLQDATLADDVAQDAWLAAAQSPPEERDRAGGLRAWLSVVVKNRVRRLVRTDRRRRAREEAARRAMASEDPADVAARAALHHEVTAAVMALDEPFRSALLWRYLDELPATEIARRQGIGHDAARKRLSRGLQLLRERFERSHPGGFAAWCVAWTRALGPGAAAPLAAMSFLTVMLMNKWLLLVGGALGAALWFSWPTAPLAPPPDAQRTADAGATAAGSSPAAPAPRAAERTADNVAAGLVLTVVDGEQRPRADVHVFALARSELVARTTTGADGTARFAAALAADEWLLATAGTVPVRLPHAPAAAAEQLVFAAGAEVRGEVRGLVPAGFALRLEHDAAAPVFADLGAAALAALGELGLGAAAIALPLAADRTFRFAGLGAGWSGALRGPDGFALREPSHRGAIEDGLALLLLRPANDLVLEFAPPRMLRGRVLAAGAPLPGCDVLADDAQDLHGATEVMATTAGDGTFALPVRDLDAAAPLLVSLAVHAGGGGLLQRRVTIPAALAEFDIGDLVVGGPLAVRVVDEAGAAVAGAQVHALGEGGESASGRADAAGEVRLPAVPATARRLLVTATGFARAQQDLPPSGTATVRLVQANGLVVRVLAADGRPAPALALHVAADRLPFRAPGAGEAAAAPFAATLPLDAGGETRLDDLEPGVLLRLAAVDDLGQVLGAAEVVTPRTPTATTVVVTTTLRSFAFAGVVRDEAGRPVPRARVYVEADRFAQRARTDAQGRFEFGGLHGAIAGAHFEVTHPAFVPLVRSDLAIAADQEPMALVLERGRRLEVRVTQASGAPLPAGTVLAELAGNAGDLAEAVAPGTFVFANLAPRAGRVHVELGGREFEAKVQAHDTFVALAIPDLGTIDVHREAAGENGAGVCLVLTPPSGQPQRTYFRPDEEVLTLYLPPGDYRVQLERRWLGRRRVEPLGSPRDVVVRAGERQDLVLP